MKRSLLFIAVVLLVSLVVGANGFAASEIVILHTNDVHGRLESHTPRGAENEMGGLVRLASVVEDLRSQYGDKVFLLEAGDAIHGTNIVNLFDGQSAVEVLNTMGYEAMVLGNHEFNYGQEVLKARMGQADFPVLAGNVFYADGSVFSNSAYITEVNGLKVGIIGLVAQDTPIKTHPNNVSGLEFRDPIEVGAMLAEKVAPEVDLLIALSHIGYQLDQELAAAVPELDVIIGGHSHTTISEETVVNGVVIAQANEYGNQLGFLRLIVEDGDVVEVEQKLIPVTHETAKSPAIEAIVNNWNQVLQSQLSEVVGTVAEDLNGEREFVRTQETNLGNLIADVMRENVDADIAVGNGGGIRASINSGEVTVGDVYTVLPFDNTLVLLEVTGADILEALEHSVSLYPSQHGAFLQVSGMTFEFDAKAEAGSRVTEVLVNGQPLDEDATYKLATNDFLAAGGDGYEVFSNGKVLTNTGIMLRDVMVEHILDKGVVGSIELGRITVK